MKRFDKYVLREFFLPFLTVLCAFVFLFVIFDISSRLDEFIEKHLSAAEVIRFYAMYIPQMVVVVMPVSLLLGIFYSFGRLVKNREILALRAAGISLLRISRPLFFTGLLCAASVFYINEYIVTNTYAETEEFVKRIKGKDQSSDQMENQSLSYQGGLLIYKSFDVRKKEISGLNWDYPGSETDESINIIAEQARYIGGQWWLSNVQILYHNGITSPTHKSRVMYTWDFTPQDLASEKDIKEMRFNTIWQHLRQRAVAMLPEDIRVMKLQLHQKAAMPLLNLLVVMISLPLCLKTKASGSIFVSLGLSLFLSFSYYGFFMIGKALGSKGLVAPWLAIWYPNILFLIMGSILIRRMEH